MGLKGTEKDRIVGKNVIEGRRTDGNRREQTETDGDGRRMFENKFYVTWEERARARDVPSSQVEVSWQ